MAETLVHETEIFSTIQKISEFESAAKNTPHCAATNAVLADVPDCDSCWLGTAYRGQNDHSCSNAQ